jgi:hypothetical protein
LAYFVVGSGILNVASRELRLSPVNLPINDAEGGFDGRDSAVLVRSRVRWIVALSRLSGVVPEKCDAMVRDLTFELRRSLDLHVHPFVPLDSFDDDFGHRSPIPSSQPSG